MNLLKDILYKTAIDSVIGSTDKLISDIYIHSLSVSHDGLFVAIKGDKSDGHKYINDAINRGASAIICEILPKNIIPDVTYVKVKKSASALGHIAANYYDQPSESLQLIGVTGTNGKTTIATLLYNLYERLGYPTGLLSTIQICICKQKLSATHTTPDALSINKILRQMVDAGVRYCFMEVSSHGIAQHRVEGLHFTGGIFTNLSRDHLDYHPSFSDYRDTKKSFFDKLPIKSFLLTNKDDKNGMIMTQNTAAKTYTYALRTVADYNAKVIENDFGGLYLRIDKQDLYSKLIGRFNAYNLLAVYSSAMLLGNNSNEVLCAISELDSISGRFEYFVSKNNITAIVDYAHTPDALKNILETINDIRTKNEQLFTVVGCGGNRDKGKRPQMGRIAASLSDQLILTSDNPRDEDPESIIQEMTLGIEPIHYKKSQHITDRTKAIISTCKQAQSGDIILVAGKGHETYQEIDGKRIDFDDMKILKEQLIA